MSESVPTIEVTRTIGAPPDQLYGLVSDMTRMGEWSPENCGGHWSGGASKAAVGAKFRGRNKIGWRRWSTTSTVTRADPGRSFAFRSNAGPLPIAEWEFRFAPAADGESTVVTQSCRDVRRRFMRGLGTLVTGVRDRDTHNRAGMEATLAGLAAVAVIDDADG